MRNNLRNISSTQSSQRIGHPGIATIRTNFQRRRTVSHHSSSSSYSSSSSFRDPSLRKLHSRSLLSPRRARMHLHEKLHPFNGRVSRHLRDRSSSNHDMSPADPYLSYHDVLLTREDIDVLKDDWLTDNIISFYQEWLEHEILARHKDAHIVLLRPSMTLMLFATKDPLTLKEALPSFEGVSHIFLPINDNTDLERPEGGSHWSLLVVSTNDKAAFHYDSMSSANKREGKAVADKLGRLLGYPLSYQDLEDAPQQENLSDCGVYVCMTMNDLLTTRLLMKPKGSQVSMSMKSKRFNARQGRIDMRKTIEDLRKEGERRRSSSDGPRSSTSSRSPPRIE